MWLVELAGVLGNASQACRIHGYLRDSFYRLNKVFEEKGVDGLKDIGSWTLQWLMVMAQGFEPWARLDQL